MRLLDTSKFKLYEFNSEESPPYAIVSHRWETEVSYRELQDGSGRRLRGWSKIEGCCAIARSEGLRYIWIDTCCIDKSSSAELSEAINSMFRWYERSKVCYAYLSDVFVKDKESDTVKQAFLASKWFTRGWTLQELLAPDEVVFFDHEWVQIGTSSSRWYDRATSGILSRDDGLPILHRKRILRKDILAVTGIQQEDFQYPLGASVAKRMAWASKRKTTRQEDMAYCLMGLFDVNMPLLFGEGKKAFLRLQLQILQQSDDESIFAWRQNEKILTGLLAPSPANFGDSFNVSRLEYTSRRPYFMTNKGLHLDLEVYDLPIPNFNKILEGSLVKSFEHQIKKFWAAPLNCTGGGGIPLVIYLVDVGNHCRAGTLEKLPERYSSLIKKQHEFYVRETVTGRVLQQYELYQLARMMQRTFAVPKRTRARNPEFTPFSTSRSTR
jgi:hypothetical protein